MDAQATWQKLVDAELVRGDMPAAGDPPTPWYLRAMVGISAWIAALFVLSSLGALIYRVYDNAPMSIVIGLVLCVVAALVMRRARDGTFLGQFGLAIALAGESLLGLGLYTLAEPHRMLGWLLIAAAEIALLLAIGDRTHRTIAAFLATGAAYLSVLDGGSPTLLPALAAVAFATTALNADRSAATHGLLQPASTGVALALLIFAPVAIVAGEFDRHSAVALAGAPWLEAALLASTFVAVVGILLRRARIVDARIVAAAMLATVALVVVTWPVQGLLAALIVMIVGFAAGRPVLTGLGLVTAVAMLGWYYFSLQATLMVKSLSLMAAGAVLLVVGWALTRYAVSSEGGDHA